MGGDDVLTFDELRKVQSKERDKDTLQELGEDFFDRARNYLAMKQGNGSYVENKEYRNARNIIEDILDRRQKKLVKLAVLSVKSNVQVENLLEREREVFEDVQTLMRDYRSSVHDQLFEDTPPSDKNTTTEEITEDPDADKNATTETTPEEAESPAEEDAEMAAGTDKSVTEPEEHPETPHEEADPEDEEKEAEDPDDAEEQAADGTTSDAEDEDATDEASSNTLWGSSSDADTAAATSEPADNTPDEAEDEAADESSPAEDAADEEDVSDDEDKEVTTIRILEAVPEFMGVDLNAYGPFEEGDETTVPDKNAEVLINQGKAEPV